MSISELINNSREISKSKKKYLLENIGLWLGGGAEGEVYKFGDRAIKFSKGYKRDYLEQLKIVKILAKYDRALVSKIYEQTYLGYGNWYTIMEMMKGLSGEEILSIKNLCSCYLKDCIDCDSFGNRLIDRTNKRMVNLDRSLNYLYRAEGLIYKDWHSGNVMKSKQGVWKVVDINSFEVKE